MCDERNGDDDRSRDASASDSGDDPQERARSFRRKYGEVRTKKALEAASALAGFREREAAEDRRLAERGHALEAEGTSLVEARRLMSAVLAECREIPEFKRRLEENLPQRYKKRLRSKLQTLKDQRLRARVRLVKMIEAEASERRDSADRLQFVQEELRYWTLHWGGEGVADELIDSLTALRDEAERRGHDAAEERANELAQLAGLPSIPWTEPRSILETILGIMYRIGAEQRDGDSNDALSLGDFIERVRPFFTEARTRRHYDNDLKKRAQSQPVRWAASSTKLAILFDILYRAGVETVRGIPGKSPPGFKEYAETLLPAFVDSETGLEFDYDADIQKHYRKSTHYRDDAEEVIEEARARLESES